MIIRDLSLFGHSKSLHLLLGHIFLDCFFSEIMLFNSLTFLLAFVPIVFGIFFALGQYSNRSATIWLGFASMFFYAWWLPKNMVILLTSIVINYIIGRLIVGAGEPGNVAARRLLSLAIVSNLLALGYYKYAGFFVQTTSTLFGQSWTAPDIVLPLGISFFTFTQLAYLVDSYQGKVKEADFSRYLLFVTYFPHLIAGPVIHHKDVMPQFDRSDAARWCSVNVAAGVAIFAIGLFKKVVIADNLMPFAVALFDVSVKNTAPGLLQAWGGSLAYTLQLYFDFSGYSDMAIGLSLALNVRLPINFNSPYKARSIIDFWKRWHISLSTFLRDYLYIPLGGNRHGQVRRFGNLFLTMLIGGLWHGAGWTFIVWGGLHGLYITINHAWRYFRESISTPVGRIEETIGWGVTFVVVVVAWVFFRATSFNDAWSIIAGMYGAHGVGSFLLPGVDGQVVNYLPVYYAILGLLWIVLAQPNSQQLVTRWLVHEDHLGLEPQDDQKSWRNVPWWVAIVVGMIAAISLMHVSQPTQFLYFNF